MKYMMLCFTLIISLLVISCGKKEAPVNETQTTPPQLAKNTGVIKDYEKTDTIKTQMAKLADVEISVTEFGLSEDEKKALPLLVRAAQFMDKLFLRQVDEQNETLLAELQKTGNPDYALLKQYFTIMAGPWDRLNDHHPFINLSRKKPDGANFYPVDMKKEEFENHIKANPADEPAFTSNFTVIRRKDGKLTDIPYSEFYRDLLDPAALFLREAAGIIQNPSLKKYLNSRADAFATNDYFQSDMDWMDLKDHKIEIVIGPYEVYEDNIFNYKAAFECFITLVDVKESNRQKKLIGQMDAMERHLPLPEKHKNFKRGKSSPIIVADQVFSSGDTRAGVQTIAFNLPNDEKVREAKGTKKVMLRNICRAKYEKILTPISAMVMKPENLPLLSFDAFFNQILMHEIAHGLGPGTISKNGADTTVNKELKEFYTVIEEIKADICGLYSFKYMINQNVFPKSLQKSIYATFLAGIFRSMRFGVGEAHGGSNSVQLNFLLEKGGFGIDEATGKFTVDEAKIGAAVKLLAEEILMIEALGDYDKAGAFISKYRPLNPQAKKLLDQLTAIPTDIHPIYTVEKNL